MHDSAPKHIKASMQFSLNIKTSKIKDNGGARKNIEGEPTKYTLIYKYKFFNCNKRQAPNLIKKVNYIEEGERSFVSVRVTKEWEKVWVDHLKKIKYIEGFFIISL